MSVFYDRAMALKSRGYTVVPIKRGSKAPKIDGWQHTEFTERQLHTMSLNGYAEGNIGINTRYTPAVDIDVTDEDMAQLLEEWLLMQFGDTGVRVGKFPKRLLIFRTDKPYKKLQSTFMKDGVKHKLEILGDGQQFVAYGEHPDTHKDYEWTSFDQPLDTEVADLPLLTWEKAVEVIEAFEQMCTQAGWTQVSSTRGQESGEGGLEDMKPVLRITEDAVVEALDWLPNDDAEYDDYFEVGCALHHQFGGNARGLELWHQWAERSSKYDGEDVNRRYASMGHGPSTVTFATILMKARREKEKAEDQEFEAALNRVDTCNDKRELQKTLAKQLMTVIKSDLQYDEAVRHVQRRIGELSDGMKPRVESVRKMLDKYVAKTEKSDSLPTWCEHWYFLAGRNMFYNVETGEMLVRQAFDGMHLRHVGLEEQRPSDMALGLYKMPVVYDTLYMPGFDEVVKVNGLDYVNAFRRSSTPKDEPARSPDAKLAVRRMLTHFDLLFPDKKERDIFMDYLAYTVQYPKEKINWCVVIQGVDGAGKSWFASLMSAVLGGANVRNVNATQLKEHYTKWAEGYRMVFFEEIRLKSEKKFEIMDKLRPYATNETIEVRRMQKDAYEIPNMTNYVMFTNYPDALPLNENDRRYFIIKTSFQTINDIRHFKRTNPNYFADLFGMLDFDFPALRHYFLNREISDAFEAKGDAPVTEARREMIQDSESGDDLQNLESMIEDPEHPWVSDAVLVASAAKVEMGALSLLNRRAFADLLHRAGFAKLGQYRLGGRDSPIDTVYTRHGELFRGKDPLTVIKSLLREPDNPDDGFD
jgi:hypothetical protein